MPLPGVHAARQMEPGKCDRIRSEPNKFGSGVHVQWCVRAGKPVEVQSIHFDAGMFTPEEARAWLKKHGFSAAKFEVASGPAKGGAMKSAAAAAADALDTLAAAVAVGTMPTEIRCSAGGTCEFLEAQVSAVGGSPLPRVNLLAYTGVPMRLDGFHLPVVVDLESLRVPRQQIPILRGHHPDKIAGHTEGIGIQVPNLRGVGVLSGTPEHTADILHTAKNGFPWQVSLGASLTGRPQHVPAGESVKVNGRDWGGPLLVARGAVLRELSVLSMGADGNTDAGFAAGAAGNDLQSPDRAPGAGSQGGV